MLETQDEQKWAEKIDLLGDRQLLCLLLKQYREFIHEQKGGKPMGDN